MLAAAPEHPQAHPNLRNPYLTGNRPEEQAAYEEALQRRPGYADAWHNPGLAEMRQGHSKEPIECFTRSLELRPDRQESQRTLAATLAEAGRGFEAIAYIRKVLRIGPSREEMRRLPQPARQEGTQD